MSTAEQALMLDALNRREITRLHSLLSQVEAALPADEPIDEHPWALDGYTPEDARSLGRDEGKVLLGRQIRVLLAGDGPKTPDGRNWHDLAAQPEPRRCPYCGHRQDEHLAGTCRGLIFECNWTRPVAAQPEAAQGETEAVPNIEHSRAELRQAITDMCAAHGLPVPGPAASAAEGGEHVCTPYYGREPTPECLICGKAMPRPASPAEEDAK